MTSLLLQLAGLIVLLVCLALVNPLLAGAAIGALVLGLGLHLENRR